MNKQDEKKPEEIKNDPAPVAKCADCDALTKERDEFKSKYLRALADYQNFEKRMAGERQNIRTNTIRDIFVQLLPFLDHLEKAEVFIKDKGLSMIKDQYLSVLKDIGIKEIDLLNEPFDPHTAEAVDVVEGEKDNIIVEVLRKGYIFKDYLLRPAQVKVEKLKSEQS